MEQTEVLQMALIGYQKQLQQVDEAISEIKRALHGPTVEERVLDFIRPKRTMSKEARLRISRAQRQRWADWRRKHRNG